MASSFEAILSIPVQDRASLEKLSKLRYTALIEGIICGTDRNFTNENLASLSDCSFIRRHENLLIQGAYSGGIPFTYSSDIRSLNCC